MATSVQNGPDLSRSAPESLSENELMPSPKGWRRVLSPITHRVGGKIISPYLAIVFVLAILGTYVVMNLVTSSLEEKFRSQLADAGRAANESVVDMESDHLKIFRQMAFTEGVPERLKSGDSDGLLTLIAPIVANSKVDYVDVLDAQGKVVLVIRPPERTAEAANLVDRNASAWPPVQKVLNGVEDQFGDKFSSLVQTPWGLVLYTTGPVKLAGERVGVIAVGTPIEKIAMKLSQDAIAGITLYGPDGSVVASSLTGAQGAVSIEPAVYQQLMASQDQV